MLGEREAADLERSRQYIAAVRGHGSCRICGSITHYTHEHPQNLTDALFGPYTCPRCCSYLHDEAAHGDYCECCGSTRNHPEEARDVCPTYERWAADQ